jgi:hypothetical protein
VATLRQMPRLLRALAGLAAAFGLASCAAPRLRPLDAELLAALAQRTEAARGLRFDVPVEAWIVAPDQVGSVLEAELEAVNGSAVLEDLGALVRALGLVPPGTDLRRTLIELQSRAVAGFYAPLGRRLYVVAPSGSAALPPGAAPVLVHELTHALQASHSVLLDLVLGLDDHWDVVFAVGALLEGDALRASFRDQELLEGILPTPAEAFEAEFALEWSQAGPWREVPRWLRDGFLLQYPRGYLLVERLARTGGLAALDAAFRDPPLSSAVLLHPEAYLGPGGGPGLPVLQLEPEIVAPDGDCREVARNSFGELGLRIWLEERGAASAGAVEGWDGDRALLLECPTGPAVAWLVQLATDADAIELERRARAAGRGTPVLDARRAGRRLLLSRGMSEARQVAALGAPGQRYSDLEAFLAARPDVLQRAAARRRAAGSE